MGLGAIDCLHEVPGPLYHSYPRVGTGYCRHTACRVTSNFSLDGDDEKFKSNFEPSMPAKRMILDPTRLLGSILRLHLIFTP